MRKWNKRIFCYFIFIFPHIKFYAKQQRISFSTITKNANGIQHRIDAVRRYYLNDKIA